MRTLNVHDQLVSKLVSNNRFWSFDMNRSNAIPDDILIEKTLVYLDIEDINLLFRLYPHKKIKQVWLDRIAIQGAYFNRLNNLLAWMYFGIKNPDRYLKKVENKHLSNYQCKL